MALNNQQRVRKGLDLLRAGVVPFVERELKAKLGGHWATDVTNRQRGLTLDKQGNVQWDSQGVLKTMIDNWQSVFRFVLGHGERAFVGELLEVRNKSAHERPFSSDDVYRALDTIERLLESVSARAEAKEVNELRLDLQRTVYAEQARSKTRTAIAVEGTPKAGLKGWRDIVAPHQDVASGRYMQAEFAADLAQVARGQGSDEYKDPSEFFRRTFITDGLQNLLVGALNRLTGRGSDPVVELQTNFGGGKTHSMLALYHLFSDVPSSKLAGMENLLKAAEVKAAPAARRAVLVGTAMSVGEVSRKPDGTEVRTLWGEMAWQLGGADGFAMVADSDRSGTSPGSKVLAELFTALSPCLVLIDEWVAYARQTVDKHDLPSGSFEAQASFAQALTEAAKAAEKTLVVASVPASKIEIGGEHGEYALEALRNVFERLGAPWRPASADEGFEIVRRRLFEPIAAQGDFTARDAVVNEFARMYRESAADFPSGCAEGAYRRKLEAAYPIHPELFDKLYGEWSTLDKFQRTRGVLRLLAKVIHRLWENGDSGLLIMPSSVPMDDSAVKSELTRYLADVWEPIISADVDGPNSVPLDIDRTVGHLGRYSASRRVARTLYVGTAPGAEAKNPGIDDRSVRLGCAQPGESPATFGDALRRVTERAKHIHQDGNRYWISTKTNINHVAEDRAADWLRQAEELHAEIVRRLRKDKTRGDFAAVHMCPESSAEVGDEPEARLVVIGPQHTHRRTKLDSKALAAARDILEGRGNSPRINRNTLVFLAADDRRLQELMQAAAAYLAWNSIVDEWESLNLDASQKRQAEQKRNDNNEATDLRIKETWVHALVPNQPDATGPIGWDEIKVNGSETLPKRTSTKLVQEELLLPEMGGERLRIELDKYLWTDKDHVGFGQLAEWFPRYLYLPRVKNRSTLMEAVREGAGMLVITDTFAFAAGRDEATGRYIGLKTGGGKPRVVDSSSLVVKPDVAAKQVEHEAAQTSATGTASPSAPGGAGAPLVGGESSNPGAEPEPPAKPNLFVASVALDGARLGRDAGRVAEEILQHLSVLPDAQVEVRLEMQVRVPGGVDDDVVRTVSENCNTMKFGTHSFERE